MLLDAGDLEGFLRGTLGIECSFLAVHEVLPSTLVVTCGSRGVSYRRLTTPFKGVNLDVLIVDTDIIRADLTSKFLNGFIGNRFFLPTKIIRDDVRLNEDLMKYIRSRIEELIRSLTRLLNDLIAHIHIPAKFFHYYYALGIAKFLGLNIDEEYLMNLLERYSCEALRELNVGYLEEVDVCVFKVKGKVKGFRGVKRELNVSLVRAYESLQAIPFLLDMLRDFTSYLTMYRDVSLKKCLTLLKIRDVPIVSNVNEYIESKLGKGYVCVTEDIIGNARICRKGERRLVIKDFTSPISIKWWLVSALTMDIVKIYLNPMKRLSNELIYSEELRRFSTTPRYLAIYINPPIRVLGIREFVEGEPINNVKDPNLWRGVGVLLGKLHSHDYVLIDTKSSNFIVSRDGSLALIDLEQCRVSSDIRAKAWDMSLITNYALFTGITDELIKALMEGYIDSFDGAHEVLNKAVSLEVSKPFTLLMPTVAMKVRKLVNELLK